MSSYIKYSLFYILLGFTPTPHALLPPMFQETLLCPSSHCLVPLDTPNGFVGPKRAFFTCQSPRSKRNPIVWISTDGQDALDGFQADGFHSRGCSKFGGLDMVADKVRGKPTDV